MLHSTPTGEMKNAHNVYFFGKRERRQYVGKIVSVKEVTTGIGRRTAFRSPTVRIYDDGPIIV